MLTSVAKTLKPGWSSILINWDIAIYWVNSGSQDVDHMWSCVALNNRLSLSFDVYTKLLHLECHTPPHGGVVLPSRTGSEIYLIGTVTVDGFVTQFFTRFWSPKNINPSLRIGLRLFCWSETNVPKEQWLTEPEVRIDQNHRLWPSLLLPRGVRWW